MSEPNVVQNSCLIEDEFSQGEDVLSTMALHDDVSVESVQETEQLKIYLDDQLIDDESGQVVVQSSPDTAINDVEQQQLWEQEHGAATAELMQAKLVIHGQVERIRHLEQALDQSLASLNELRRQVIDQQLLETQLAATEEISNVQQRAIVRLKQQLAQQQQDLEAQQIESQARDRKFQELLATMEALTQAQQKELEQMRSQISYDRGEVQAYQSRLEKQLAELQAAFSNQQHQSTELEFQSHSAQALAESLEARLNQAQTQVASLSQNLSDRQIALEQLETELRQAHTALQEQQVLIDSLQQTRSLTSVEPVAAINSSTEADQIKANGLEGQLVKQAQSQVMFQRAFQELETERDQQKARMTELESQVADMQEQILRQAQQTSEYETAVQHWKDRFSSSQTHILRLKNLVESTSTGFISDGLESDILEILAALQSIADAPEPGSPTLLPSMNRGPKVDLPDFLMRRRNYKARRS